MRITFNLPLLKPDGAERILSHMIESGAIKGGFLAVITHYPETESFFRLHPSVKIVPIDTARPSLGLCSAALKHSGTVLRLRREIVKSRPDCLIVFGEACSTGAVLATRGLNIPIIVSERSDPYYLTRSRNGWVWNLLRRALYPLADRLVVLTEGAKTYFGNSIRWKTSVIPVGIGTELDWVMKLWEVAISAARRRHS
ncbi:glycosyltransferase [Thermodesulfobacteriota bacterium]